MGSSKPSAKGTARVRRPQVTGARTTQTRWRATVRCGATDATMGASPSTRARTKEGERHEQSRSQSRWPALLRDARGRVGSPPALVALARDGDRVDHRRNGDPAV